MENIKIRLDTWLWAARFFKTRSIAKDAVNNSKIKINSTKCTKPATSVKIGDLITIKTSTNEKTVKLLQLSNKRSGYEIAKLLYEETNESIANNAAITTAKKLEKSLYIKPQHKPDKKQRRALIDHKRGL